MSKVPISAADAPPAREADSGGGLTPTFVLALGTFAVGTDAFVVAGFLPDMADALRVSTATAGQSITVFAAAYAVLSPVLATLTAPLSRRALLVGALIVLGLANLGSALAPTFPVLLLSRVLAAAGAAAYTPGAGAVSAALVRPELRARSLAVVVGGLTVATALGVPLGQVVSELLGWRTALGLVGGLCLVVAACVAGIMPYLPGGPRVPLRTRLGVLRRPAVASVLPLTVLGMGASYTVYAYSVEALDAVGVPDARHVWLLFLYGLGAVVGTFLSGFGTDRWGSTRVLGVGYLVMALSLGAFGWLAAVDASPLAVVGVVVAGWGASTWCQTPAQQHRLIALAPREAPLVVSLNSSCIYLGIGLGTLLGGTALPAGMATVCALASATAVLALAFLLLTARGTVGREAGSRAEG
ncbi:MFS transporter [Streptomyces sp. NPDC057702]|uniref:MFS transporter n=1 Tax=unclassified Streptomyces TaxID=2593676 RepID=UPI0036A02DD3